MKYRLQAHLVVGLALSLGYTSAIASSGEVSNLLSQQRYEEAYTLAKSIESSNAGDVQFDMDYARAAIDSGRAQEAIFPLERVLMMDKGNIPARLELARAYIILGDIDSAKQNLAVVKEKNPPVAVMRRVDELTIYLSKRERDVKFDMNPFVGFTMGVDSNINSATDVLRVAVPAIGGQITLGDSAKKKQDNFAEWNVGVNGKYNLSKSLVIFMGADVRDHLHANESAFDQRSWTVTVGPALSRGKHLFRLPLQANIVELNRHIFRDTQSAAFEYSFTRDKYNQYNLFTQAAKIKYPKAFNRVQNTNMFLLGAGYGKVMQHMPLKVNANLYYVKDSAKNTTGRHNGKRTWGATLSGQYKFKRHHMFYSNLGLMSVKHASPHPLFGIVREDAQNSIAFGWQWNYTGKLSFKTEANFRRNRSNTVIYQYSRTMYQTGLTYAL